MYQRDALSLLTAGKEGIDEWNAWRGIRWVAGHPQVAGSPPIPSFEGVDLSGTTIRNAELFGADLSRANLRGADLTGSDLFEARLAYTDLRDADLSHCQLGMATLLWTKLAGANLTRCSVRATTLNCDFKGAHGLETITFFGTTSVISPFAIRSLGSSPPANILHACGYNNDDVLRLHAEATGRLRYHSCFISYATADHAFAHALHGRLEAAGVDCWFAPHDMRIGDKIRTKLHETLQQRDKLVLALSRHSTTSQWVEIEVEAALEQERLQGISIVVPIRLDSSVFDIQTGWAADIRRTRHIGDFSGWPSTNALDRAVEVLLRDLRLPCAG